MRFCIKIISWNDFKIDTVKHLCKKVAFYIITSDVHFIHAVSDWNHELDAELLVCDIDIWDHLASYLFKVKKSKEENQFLYCIPSVIPSTLTRIFISTQEIQPTQHDAATTIRHPRMTRSRLFCSINFSNK